MNEHVENGICAYRKERKLRDDRSYEFHFIHKKRGKAFSEVSATLEDIEDCFNYLGIGTIERTADPNRQPSYNEKKLKMVCQRVLEKLQEPGVFKVVLILNNHFNIVPLKPKKEKISSEK